MFIDLAKIENVWDGRCLYTLQKKLVKVSKNPSPNAKITKSVTRVMKLGYISFTTKDKWIFFPQSQIDIRIWITSPVKAVGHWQATSDVHSSRLFEMKVHGICSFEAAFISQLRKWVASRDCSQFVCVELTREALADPQSLRGCVEQYWCAVGAMMCTSCLNSTSMAPWILPKVLDLAPKTPDMGVLRSEVSGRSLGAAVAINGLLSTPAVPAAFVKYVDRWIEFTYCSTFGILGVCIKD